MPAHRALRRQHARAVLIKYGSEAQKQRWLPRIPRRLGLVVPGLPGARRRLRPRVGEDDRGARP